MENLIQHYQRIVECIWKLQRELAELLDNAVNLISVEAVGENFVPTERKLSQQLKKWPEGMFPIPPAAWVDPREGVIDLKGVTWAFVFHGNGVSFTNQTTGEEVGIEFGAGGENALTRWIIYVYLEDSSVVEPLRSQLLAAHSTLFDELEKKGSIVPVPPRLPGSDATFILHLMNDLSSS